MNSYLEKLIRILASITLAVITTGCASYRIVKLGNIDKSQKTITVPTIGFSMTELKLALISNGWKLKTSNVTRYRMTVQEDIRMSEWVLKTYISIVDNKTNEEVLSIVGDSNGAGGVSPTTTANKLMAAIEEIER